MNRSIGVAFLPLIGILAACSFAPAYRTPDSAPPGTVYKEAGDWQPAQPLDTAARGAWWRLFHDETLDALEAKVDSAETFKAGFARVQEARAATRIARADLFPTLDAASSAGRQRISQNSPTYVKGYEPVFNNFDLEADLSYEIDLWGRVRNTVIAAKATNRRAPPISRPWILHCTRN
jgi:outer membrane protein, multidrug efflux system